MPLGYQLEERRTKQVVDPDDPLNEAQPGPILPTRPLALGDGDVLFGIPGGSIDRVQRLRFGGLPPP
jgi:hypothetical protein